MKVFFFLQNVHFQMFIIEVTITNAAAENWMYALLAIFAPLQPAFLPPKACLVRKNNLASGKKTAVCDCGIS